LRVDDDFGDRDLGRHVDVEQIGDKADTRRRGGARTAICAGPRASAIGPIRALIASVIRAALPNERWSRSSRIALSVANSPWRAAR
jgi:hypothetical protein